MHSYNPCLPLSLGELLVCRLQRQQNASLSVSLRLLPLPASLCVNCVNGSSSSNNSERGTRRILVKRTESVHSGRPENCALCGESQSRLQQPGHTLAQAERETHYRMLLRELPSADSLQCASFGLFGLLPLPGRSTKRANGGHRKRGRTTSTTNGCCCLSSLPALVFVEWSSSSSLRCSSSFPFSVHCKEHEHARTLLRRLFTGGSCLIEF